MTVAAEPTAERAGSSFFAPGIRIRQLEALQAGRQPGTDLPADVLADVRAVEITRVHNGASQYSITLNNWYTTTAHDRRGADDVGARELAGRDRPAWPRHKYNAFDVLKFGDRLRIDLRYWPDRGGDDDTDEGLNRWVPMISGPISDMTFEFGSSGATLILKGEDDMSRLRDRHQGRVQLRQAPERDQVDEILSIAGFPLPRVDPPAVEWPSFATSGDAPEESIGDGQSYLAVLEKIAGRIDLEVFIEFADLGDADGGVELHVEPARSARSPLDDPEVYAIERGTNLISFSPTLKVTDQPSEIQVRGRHRDPEIPEQVNGHARGDDLMDELRSPPSAPPVLPAGEVREHFFPDRPNPFVLPNETNLDDERGRQLALTTLRRKAREFLTIEASTIGIPRLRPGRYVELRGMRPPFDGFYYLTKTVHRYGADGYTTSFTGRRPGMPLPPYEEN